MKRFVVTLALFSFPIVHAASAATDKYQITAEEQTACGSDAVELCSGTYPNEDQLLACMKSNRVNLSAACRPIFEEGLRRRHLN